jgi:hypothetical protein
VQTFEDCICIAQARVIAGHRREPHICTIAYQPSENQFLRLCIPFVKGRSPLIKRWSLFSFQGTKDGLANDNRDESWSLVDMTQSTQAALSAKQKEMIHRKILSTYKYESELNQERDSIGLLVPIPETLRFTQERFSSRREDEKKELDRAEMLKEKGIWYPTFKVKINGHYLKDGKRNPFNKQLLAWDVYEALRLGGNRDPFAAIDRYRNPYLIIGNLATQRRGWVAIGVLSAPDGAIQECAIAQQLALV